MDKKKTSKEKKKISLTKTTTAKQKQRESIKCLGGINDLEKLFLSPLTQKVLECRIGENITPEVPWIYIKKEKIEDNMFLHDRSSEFLPIRRTIENYPEPEMLIGSYSHIQDKDTDFFLCTTIQVKEDILVLIESERKNVFERIRNLFHPLSRPWQDLGSQIEVDSSLNQRNRSLFEIVLCTEYPVPYHHSKFKICLVNDLPNSYTQTLTGRIVYNLIFRKRVDASAQSTLPKQDKAHQSQLSVLRNKHIQYSYKCKQFKMTKEALEDIKNFFQNKCDILFETLLVNFNINLYCDDYKQLAINDKGIFFKDPIELRSYQDVIRCKNKKVSCVTWHAFISGMMAVAYTVTPIQYIGKKKPLHNDAIDAIFGNHLILLWSYKDNVHPKLYIHAYREVTALSFCPYDPDILVGGYNNGQIVVWDIRNRIKGVETREALTDLEYRHRAIMMKHTSWIKPPFSINNVFPTLTSLFTSSHSSAVTSIKWIPPTHFISSMGKYEETPHDQEHMQFFSASLTGSAVLVWDLKIQKTQLDLTKIWKKRAQRLSRIPEALASATSPLKKLQKIFVPNYKFLVKNSKAGAKIPITNIVAKNQMYAYVPINPETLSNIEERTNFRMLGLKHSFHDSQQLIVSTGLGNLSIIKWEGSSYNQGMGINSETCVVTYFANVHDGPIIVCERNPFLPDILLTIGGSVFAIWEFKSLMVPLIWRKGNIRYISGMWSFRHPLTMFMTRSDSYFEIWNLLEQTEDPVRSIKYKGNRLISVFNDSSRLHVRKATFVTSDIVGSIKVFHLPSGIISLKDSTVEESILFVEHLTNIKKIVEDLRLKFKKKQEDALLLRKEIEEVQNENVLGVTESKFTKLRIENVVDAAVNKWQKRLEIHMYKTLIQKKRLNVEEIESNKKLMQELLNEEQKKIDKVNKKINERDEDFQKLKDLILVPVDNQKIRRKITVTLPKEMKKILKQKYYENFLNIQTETIRQIRGRNYKFSMNWNHMMQFGTSTRRK